MATPVLQAKRTLQARIVSGSLILLSGSGLNAFINLVYNIDIARKLGPQGYGHATVIYTIVVLLSAATLSFQIVTAKLVAQQKSQSNKSHAYRLVHFASSVCGIAVFLILLSCQSAVANYLNLSSSRLVALIAIGAGFYIPLGARRGYIQGVCGFRKLAFNLVLEQAIRLVGSIGFIALGWGLEGVVIANSLAIGGAYFAAYVKSSKDSAASIAVSQAAHEVSQAAIFFTGQIVINNCGIVLVNHFFVAREAGFYAAAAMVGRVIVSFSQAVMNSTFPLVAATTREERRDFRVIATSLLLVVLVGMSITMAVYLAPPQLWAKLFGASFSISGKYDLPYLLYMYALGAVIYSLAGVIITFEMSYRIANTSFIQLVFSVVLVGAIYFFHESLRQVVVVQLAMMGLLFVSVAVPFVIKSLTDPTDMLPKGSGRAVKLVREITEDVAIAEFLKSEFHSPAFGAYQSTLRDIVLNPNYDDAAENAKRRALLFIRHFHLWREMPTDTVWYEVEITAEDLENVRMFPRAQWRKVADGRYASLEIAEGIRNRKETLDSAFVAKIDSIRRQFDRNTYKPGSILLIGVDPTEPLTVLDGNHRLMAAVLHSPMKVEKLRCLCGFSSHMTDCCWYRTNMRTLLRYSRNVLMNFMHKPAAELARLL